MILPPPLLRRRVLRAALSLCCLLPAACALPSARQPLQQTYRLDAPDVRTAPLPQAVVVQLLPLSAAAGFASAAMMYSRSADTLEPYRDSRWLAPPSRLIADAIAAALRRQPWVSAVQQQTVLIEAPWALHCSLQRLEHDVRASAGAVRLDLTCELVDRPARTVTAHWRFDGREPIAVNDAAHFAQGAQTLLDQAIDGIVQHTRAAVQAAQEVPTSAGAAAPARSR
ncbi:MAG: ABC-type transport auxiliary lipoprotein family protein [Thiomonas sp.]